MCADVRLILVLVWKTLILVLVVGYVLCASYVCTWYQPADHSMVPGTYVQYRATSPPQKKNKVRLVKLAQSTRVRYTDMGVFSAAAGNQ